MYGNGQVSKQHVIQATSNSKLSVPKDVMHLWLTASDPIKRGIYRWISDRNRNTNQQAY